MISLSNELLIENLFFCSVIFLLVNVFVLVFSGRNSIKSKLNDARLRLFVRVCLRSNILYSEWLI